MDPIKAEICGMSDHHDEEAPKTERAPHPTGEAQEEPGVCPIRFLDQHSPEEIATYFEKHKHELPRSHEVCVKRYQSNEQQIRELDEKYGNLVSMIQGLGAKHKDMLPPEPEDEDEIAVEDGEMDPKDVEKVRKWASSVSAQVGEANAVEDEEEGEERQQHFERPLRDIRIGESPSRPWGISVPPRYLENGGSDTSSRPAQITSPSAPAREPVPPPARGSAAATKGRCPFGFDQTDTKVQEESLPVHEKPQAPAPAFISADADAGPLKDSKAKAEEASEYRAPRMQFSGPVFIGYSAEDAAKILRESGLGGGGGKT